MKKISLPSLNSHLEEWIAAAVEGDLSVEERREFDAYLEAHPETRREYEDTQTMNRLLEETFKKDEPGPDFEDRMVAGFRRKKRSRDLGFWKLWASFWQGPKTAYAGAIAALVLSFYIGGTVMERQPILEADVGKALQSTADRISALLRDGRAFDETGQYDRARARYDAVLIVDPYNAEAKKQISMLTERQTKASSDQYQARREKALLEVENGANTVVQTNGTTKLEGVDDFRYPVETVNGDRSAAQAEVDLYFNAPDPIHYESPDEALKKENKQSEETSQRVVAGSGYFDFDKDGVSSVIGKDAAAKTKYSGGNGRGDFNLNALKITLEKPANGPVPTLGDVPVMGQPFQVAQNGKQAEAFPLPAQPEKKSNAVKTVQNLPATRAAGQPTPPEEEKNERSFGAQQNQPVTAPAPEQVLRKLIRNADVGLEVRSYAAAVRDLSRMAQDDRGFVATQNDRTQANGHTGGQIVIKLPPDRLEGFVLRLRELGKIQHQVLKTDDVTKAYFDTEARLRNAKKTEDRLLELMAKKTDKVADLLQVEKEIARVRESIEQMQGELKLWDSLASLATVSIEIVEEDMDQAAAYLLKETANLSLYSADVEKSYKGARESAEKAEAQILSAEINRSANGQMNATLSLLAAPEKAFVLIEQLKALGRVQTFEQDTQRVAQDGRTGIAGTTKKDKVEINVSIVHDDASRKTVALQVVTPEVEKALDECKKAALAAMGEILTANLQRNPNGHSQAVLTVRLPAKKLEETKTIFSGQGRVVRLSVERSDNTGTNLENEDASPVILSLTLSDEQPPVQVTRLDMEGEKVAAKVEELKTRARALGVEIRASSFSRDQRGVEQANLVFRMTMKEYTGMLETLLGSGKTLSMTLDRRDRMESEIRDEVNEPVEVLFRLKSPTPIVDTESGLVSGLKRTLGRSFEALWGSVERIATGFAYLLPWLLAGGMGWLIWRRGKKRKKAD